MNRSRSVSETSVGLFAFLDVLMSTMGSLILVLRVVTPKIRQEAVARAAVAARHAVEARHAIESQDALKKSPPAYVPTAVPELPRETVDLNAKLKVQLAELSQKAKDRQSLLEANHESLAVAETSLQKNQAELDALERRLEQILNAKRHVAASITRVSSEGVAVESLLARMATRLRTLHGHIAQNSTAYTFVAYDGVTGTTRRPILIECTREHIKFLQENVSLSSTDVSGYSAAFNPVLAGAQALMDYWTTHSGPDEPRPYVLLIVRPSGPVAYGMARHLLERLKEPFGYELLPDDQLLDVPPAVPEAAEVCRRAVERAISQRVDAFKDVFGNGMGHGGGRLTGGNGGGTAGTMSSSNGNGKSPFDDVGDALLGGSGHGSQQAASGDSSGTSAQPGVPGGTQTGNDGTNSTATSAQTSGGPQGTGPFPGGGQDGANAGIPGTANAGTPASNSIGTGGLAPGNQGSGSASPENHPGGVLVSNSGSGASNQSPGPGIGSSSPGLGIKGAAATGNGSGSSLVNGGTVPGAGIGTGNGVGSSPLNGGTGNGDGPAGGLPGTAVSQGDRVTGSSPGTLPSGAAAPRVGTPTSAMPPGGSSPGGLVPGGDATSANSPGGLGEADQGDLPPSLLPPSAGGAAANAAMKGDKLAVGHPTLGAANDEVEGSSTATQPRQATLDSGLFGSAGSPSTATSASASGPVGSGTPGSAAGQSGESPPSMPGSSGQPQAGEAGGSPSMGAPPDGASDGEAGPSGASSDASTSNKPSGDSGSVFTPNADEDDAPRRKAQPASRHWGISSPGASIGYEHDLSLYIESGRIFVGNQPPISCGRRENSDQLALAVLRAINREARTWGRPRQNFYWIPSLKIVVCAGGILQYERLQPAFERQGLSSSAEFRLEKSRPAPLPRLVTD